MLTTLADDDLKSARLRKLFIAITEGKKAIQNANDAKIFIEAVCSDQERSSCVEKLVAAPQGLQALKMSLRSDVSIKFISNHSANLLHYIADDAVRQLCNGLLLDKILIAIAEPPTFWNALISYFQEKSLPTSGILAFAKLLLELLSSPPVAGRLDIFDIAGKVLRPEAGLIDSQDEAIRDIAQKIQRAAQSRTSGSLPRGVVQPGGRHDNDFEDFRQIAIFPTMDEFSSKEKPYYQEADAIFDLEPEDRVAAHLDNQFRLLREDMLAELRSDLLIDGGGNQGKRVSLRLSGLEFQGIYCGDERCKPAAVALRCTQKIPRLHSEPLKERKKFLKDNSSFLRHNSFGCLLNSKKIVAFATIDRNIDMLAEDPPVLLLQVFGSAAFLKALITLKTANQRELEFVSVDTAYFAYEPILKCLQEKSLLPLSEELLGHGECIKVSMSPFRPDAIVAEIVESAGCNLRDIFDLPMDVVLDHSQTQSLIAGLSQKLSLIQGPPGTGKSFIGAIMAKILLKYTKEKIIVLCFTNHALDQFLEDILDIGVAEDMMLRMGSKSTARTKGLRLFEQTSGHYRSKEIRDLLAVQSLDCEGLAREVVTSAANLQSLKISKARLLDYLQYSDDESDFFYALSVPENEEEDEEADMAWVDQKGKVIKEDYLLNRWLSGLDAGVFKDIIEKQHANIWRMDRNARTAYYRKWTQDFYREQAVILRNLVQEYTEKFDELRMLRDANKADIIRGKRIIGCTTTAAAKYTKELMNARAGIVIVEEAGEILEPHILTALSPNTQHVVMIGDHDQLRPKINNYELSVEKGDGFDLNKSAFERLVRGGYPHVTLTKQHRMRPEISSLVRNLTYPNLEDAPNTMNRPDLLGFQCNIVFINHSVLEVDEGHITDRRDGGSSVSRKTQQGYGTDKQVVLTPYLAQLRLLHDYVKADHDPVLNDLDSFDLARAGLLPPGINSKKRPLRISTIDNYQGEESDIVIASLTRSNKNCDIGFMSAPQRLNVLLSRARNALIIFGNANTFTNSRKGAKVWGPFIEGLREKGYVHDGIPIKCERHPEKKRFLKKAEDFDKECPDGGCEEPCQFTLSCGKHSCPQRCHRLSDHSSMKCEHMIDVVCPKKHRSTIQCWEENDQCRKCVAEAKRLEAQQKRNLELDLKRQENEADYAQKLAEIDIEIATERRLQKEREDQKDREHTLQQRRQDLANARAATAAFRKPANTLSNGSSKDDTKNTNQSGASAKKKSPTKNSSDQNGSADFFGVKSPAKDEWDYQKNFENADNEHIDALMGMIGLEDVKQHVLDIKTKVDTCIRQGASLKSERFGASLLGNPGTGKTTVARLYAKILASLGVLPGATIKERTAAKLISDGVKACEKLIEEVLNSGGGAIFIDEAYQLASDNNSGGRQVLDFLLAEVENLTGKVVFILAGYNKQMEKFFAHNPGLPSRFPHEMQFKDYEDIELRQILEYQVKKRFSGRMKVELGHQGLYCRIVARRVGYGRGREGFGNARAVENTFTRVLMRQATRLKRERRAKVATDDLFLTKEDLIGPPPSDTLKNNSSWIKLQSLTGIAAVKEAIRALFDSIQHNYDRELKEAPLIQFSLNRVFVGSPGTGKTTVAKLYGQILADIGFLSNGEVVVKNSADFIGDVIGGSEKATKGILASTVGKVLVIDEAYGLYGGSSTGTRGQTDIFRTAVIDTLVGMVQSVPGDDRCVLLLGYRAEMERMLQNVNPGLTRRFPLSEAFEFEDFSDHELKEILELKLNQQAYKATDQAKTIAMEILKRARNRPNFGNAGEIDILLNGAKARHQQRRSTGKAKDAATLDAVDMDPDFDRGERAATNIRLLFKDVVGCDGLVEQIEGYQKTAANMKARGMDPREQLPFNFLFRGPPGTGKTTTATKMGKVYYDIGLLATAEVVVTSATDLVGEYIGHTGPKTQKLLEKALGKVLFIDEAYRLAEGQFAKEAMDEIVDCLTKPAFARKLIVILAGYDADINRLMSINPGLTSRFPETVLFQNLTAEACLKLLTQVLKKKKHLDTGPLSTPSEFFTNELLQRIRSLSVIANWANGRDVKTLADNIFNKVLRAADPKSSDPLRLDEASILDAFDAMIIERSSRAKESAGSLPLRSRLPTYASGPQSQGEPPFSNPNPSISTFASTDDAPSSPTPPVVGSVTAGASAGSRDSNVSDEIWAQLASDKQAEAGREQRYQDLLLQQAVAEAQSVKINAEHAAEEERELKDKEAAKFLETQIESANIAQLDKLKVERDKSRHQLEQKRIEREVERRKHDEELATLKKERQRAEEERRAEVEAQKKLRHMGLCVAGFRWTRQDGGYRCAGGTHYVSNAAIENA